MDALSLDTRNYTDEYSIQFGSDVNYSKNCGTQRSHDELELEELLAPYSDKILIGKDTALDGDAPILIVDLYPEVFSKLPKPLQAIVKADFFKLTKEDFCLEHQNILRHVKILHALLESFGLAKPIAKTD